MLQLRKILLSKYPYYGLFILTIIITLIRLSLPIKSSYNEKSNTYTGIVIDYIKEDNKTRITLKNKKELIEVTYYKEINIKLGDKLKVLGIFTKPNNNTYKYLFNYRKYLQRKNIFYIIKANKIILLKKNNNIYYYLKEKTRTNLNNNPYLLTFILGDKRKIKKEIKTSYQENGISHLFAISGMHISLLSSLINRLLKKIKLREETIYKITSIVLIIYLLLVGLSPSILRGILFYILFTMNSIYYFYIKPFHLFIGILSISLLINPYYIFDVGYLYSYLISLSLILFKNKLESNNYFISLLKVSILSFFVSIPISLYNFYQINILGIIYNLLFVPLISIIIFPLSIIVTFIKPLRGLYLFLISILENTSLLLSKISIGKLIFKRLPLIIYMIYFIIIILFLFHPKKIFIYIFITILFIHYNINIFNNTKTISYIDVKQGDSTLIEINNRYLLIDTGGLKYSSLLENTHIPILKSRGIKKIDYLIITHGDFDHMGETINLVENFKVEKVVFNCGPYNDLEQELIKVLDKKKIKYYSCIKELNIDKNKLYFLNTKEYDNENDNSNVIYTELNGYKFMFMGDAGVEKEKDILDKYNLSNIDVLKVGHHGSRTSSSKEFIDEINPKYSVISVGKNNRYGHPNKEVLKNLSDSKTYRTDQDGSIIIKIKNKKLKIETCSP